MNGQQLVIGLSLVALGLGFVILLFELRVPQMALRWLKARRAACDRELDLEPSDDIEQRHRFSDGQ